MNIRKILVMGLPGTGKTTLARLIAARLNAVHFNADEVRTQVNRDLGFSQADRVEQARRMGWLCDQVTRTGGFAVADFICPTRETRAAFTAGGEAAIIWMDRAGSSHFADTDALFTPPERADLRVGREGTPEYWCERVARLVSPVFDPKRPTALFLGRYQPFHDGHRALVAEGIRRIGQACVAVRDTAGIDARSPFPFEEVKARIDRALREYEGRFIVVPLPNITNVFYGRDVGYAIGRIDLEDDLKRISATTLRARLAPPMAVRPGIGS